MATTTVTIGRSPLPAIEASNKVSEPSFSRVDGVDAEGQLSWSDPGRRGYDTVVLLSQAGGLPDRGRVVWPHCWPLIPPVDRRRWSLTHIRQSCARAVLVKCRPDLCRSSASGFYGLHRPQTEWRMQWLLLPNHSLLSRAPVPASVLLSHNDSPKLDIRCCWLRAA